MMMIVEVVIMISEWGEEVAAKEDDKEILDFTWEPCLLCPFLCCFLFLFLYFFYIYVAKKDEFEK